MTIALLLLSCGCRFPFVWPSGEAPAVGTAVPCPACHRESVVADVD